MPSPAGLGSPARRARKQAAATAVEALAAGAPLVVELSEVGGEGCIIEPTSVEPTSVEPSVEAAEGPSVTPGGCSGRGRLRRGGGAVAVGRSSAAAGPAGASESLTTVIVR